MLPVVVRKPSDFVIDAGELGMLTYHSESMRPNSDNNNNTWDCFPGIDITPEQESQLCEAVETQANNFVSAAEAYAYNNADFALTDWMSAEVLQSDIDNMRDICNSMVRSKSVADVLYNERSFSAFTLVNKPCFLYTITKGGVPVYGCYFDLTCRGKSCINGFSNWYACEDTKTTTDLIFAVEDGKIKFVYSTPGCFFDKQLS